MSTVAIAGSSGFIGGAVTRSLVAAGVNVRPLPSLRDGSSADDLLRLLDGCDALINAAGMAEPASNDASALYQANAVLPEVLAQAATKASVRRYVHISSAAVQGRRDPLDESVETRPFSPYSASKAEGERRLLAHSDGPTIVIYRATSVQGPNRGVTSLLSRYASLPILPIVARGERPIPVALLENTAAAVAHLATTSGGIGPIVLHPWEGITVGSLLRSFGWNDRRLPVPMLCARAGVAAAGLTARWSPRVKSRLRSVELMLVGQSQNAHALHDDGFVLPVGVEGYERLASEVDIRRKTVA